MTRKDIVVKEIWEDGSETFYLARETEYIDAMHRVNVRWDSMQHVFAQHGTTIIRPVRFELVNSTDRKLHWHPNTSLSSLVRGVFLLKEKEHYYEYA